MDNKSYVSTNFESGRYTLATLYDCAGDPGTQFELSPIQAAKSPRNSSSTPGEYSLLSHSGPSSQNLLQANYTGHDNQQSLHSSAQLYDTAYKIPVNHRSDDANAVTTNRSQKSGSVWQCKSLQVVMIVLLVLILLILVAFLVMILLFFYLSSKDLSTSDTSNAGLNNGNSNTTSYNQLLLLQNRMDDILKQMNDFSAKNNSLLLDFILKQITSHGTHTNSSTNAILQELKTSKKINIPTAAAINDILVIVNELLELQNGSSLFNSIRPVSCNNIKVLQPNSPTGYYHINNRSIYCNMDVLCGVGGGGWTRLAYLDMSDSGERCPYELTEWPYYYYERLYRVCGRPNNFRGCKSVKFPTNGIAYTQICGRVIGYQKGSTNGIGSSGDINSAYLDGVSITRGSPREHVWSYIAGLRSDWASSCPCSINGSNVTVPSFVGNNYYCESGTNSSFFYNVFYGDDPLWDGQKCPSLEAPCCTSPKMLPWFHRDYGNVASTDYLELRVCCDQYLENEDVPISLYEIYIK